jgi:trigger factor
MFNWLKKDKDASKGGAAVLEKDAPEIKVKVLERKGCQAVLAVTVPADEVSAAVEEAYKDVQRQARMPGFRPGKAPMELIRKNFHGQAVEHGINNLLRETVHHALEQEKIVPLTVPSVDKVDFHEGKPMKYEVKVECPPEVVLKSYTGLPLSKPARPDAAAELEKRLDGLRENNAKLAPSTDETVLDKHFVLADYEATLDGKPVDGGKAQDQMIEIAAPQSMSGLNEGLKGMKKGETKDIPVQFPAEHPSKLLAGKTVDFKVTLKDIKEKQVPAADDEFAKDLGLESLAALKERLAKNLESETIRKEREALEKQVIEALLERHPFEVPPSQVEERAAHLTERLKSFLMSQGASEADWTANQAKMTEKNRPEAEKQVRTSYLLVEIAKKEKIEAGDADVDAALEKAVKDAAPGKADEMRKWFEERREGLKAQIREEKIFDFLIQQAQVTEQKAS